MTEANTPDFDDKVRFARAVEVFLMDPVLGPAPHLGLRIRERMLLEEVRRARRAGIHGAALSGVSLTILLALPLFLKWEFIQAGLGAFVRSAPVLAGASAYGLALHSPLVAMSNAPGVGLVVFVALLAGFLLYLVRDLFTDPFEGLHPRTLER